MGFGSNVQEAMRGERTMDRLKLPSLTSAMGQFSLEDMVGMEVAIAVLDRSLDPGLHAEFVQWETFRRTRSAVTNILQAGVFGMGSSVGVYEQKKMWISEVVGRMGIKRKLNIVDSE
jgi:3-hydroxyacyl-CoA dehydrogenase